MGLFFFYPESFLFLSLTEFFLDMECPYDDIVAATEVMLRYRGHSWTPPPEEWADSFGFLLPAEHRCARHASSSRRALMFHTVDQTLTLITDATRIGMSHLRQAYDLLRSLNLRDLHLVSKHPLTTQTTHMSQCLPADHRVPGPSQKKK